jgi:hypothetical protein
VTSLWTSRDIIPKSPVSQWISTVREIGVLGEPRHLIAGASSIDEVSTTMDHLAHGQLVGHLWYGRIRVVDASGVAGVNDFSLSASPTETFMSARVHANIDRPNCPAPVSP